jgi:flagellar biosynthesis protein FlhA
MERAIESAVEHTEHSSHLNLPPQKIREILDRVSRAVGSVENPVVAVCSSGARFFLRQIVEGSSLHVSLLSHSEIPAGVKVVSLGLIQ